MSGDRNDDLAYQALDYIREHPEEWDQQYYFCGTTACFAGRVLIIDAANHDEHLDPLAAVCPDTLAAVKLGWTGDEASYVFHFLTRDFSELERRVKNVLNDEVPRKIS